MEIVEIDFKSKRIESVLSLSLEWEKEYITYGYVRNDLSNLNGNRIFVATVNDDVVAYLFGKEKFAKNISSVIPDGRKTFVIDELYVVKELRSKGI